MQLNVKNEQISKFFEVIEPWLIKTRRDFHKHPELGFKELRTANIIKEYLIEWGLEVYPEIGITGVVGVLKGNQDSPVIALRADMDGLPIQDQKSVPYKSTIDGVMHACGHDAHITMLLGAAYILSKFKRDIPGKIIFVFQPAEEGPGGANRMINEGVLEGVDMIFAQHVDPMIPVGQVGIQEYKAMAAIDKFKLKVNGISGHGAYPHQSVDAILVSAHLITAFQSIVSRMIDPLKETVITIGTINGGYRRNVIADSVEMGATIRTFDPDIREKIPHLLERVIKGITSSYGATYKLDYEFGYDPLLNDPLSVQFFKELASKMDDIDSIQTLSPVMSSEDFGSFLSKVPGCFWWLGVGSNIGLHNPMFDIDERALKIGVNLLINTAINALEFSKERGSFK